MSRKAEIVRRTAETSIRLALCLDGSDPDGSGPDGGDPGEHMPSASAPEAALPAPSSREPAIRTGFGLLDHMLALTAFWAGFDLHVRCEGDMEVDAHHSVEDVGLCFGQALGQALGERRGIARVGFARVPMDEALAEVTLDLSGRAWLEWRGDELLPPPSRGRGTRRMAGMVQKRGRGRAHEHPCPVSVRKKRASPVGVGRQGTGPCAGAGRRRNRKQGAKHQRES